MLDEIERRSSRLESSLLVPWFPRLFQVFLEKLDGARPRLLRRRGVVAGRGVVVEAVLRAGVEEDLILLFVLLERLLVRGPARIDPLIGLRVVDEQRRLDLQHVLGRRLVPIEG